MEIKAETFLGDSINVKISHKLIVKMLRKTKPSVEKISKIADWYYKKKKAYMNIGSLSRAAKVWYWNKENDFNWNKHSTEELWSIYLEIIK